MDSIQPIKYQQNSAYQPSMPTSGGGGFPILAIAVLGIMATAFLLVSYYVLVTKCCLNWQHIDPLRRFSVRRAMMQNEDPLMAYSPSSWQQNRGLDEILIREIPTFQYNRCEAQEEGRSMSKCVVCLNEFQEQDMLRVLPNCSHAFHLDCIDVWLQNNANCPLCRLSISGTTRHPVDRIIAPTSSPQDPQPFVVNSLAGGEEDFVVIELSAQVGTQRNAPREHLVQNPGSHSSRKLKPRKFHHVSIMGDECLNVRGKDDDQFAFQPIRRSFSMDSAVDRHVYSSIQEATRQSRHPSEVRDTEESSSRVRKPFFSFGHGRGSKNAVLPL